MRTFEHNGLTYTIKFSKKLRNGKWGSCNEKKRIIFVKDGLSSQEMRWTILHELLHILFPDEPEEKIELVHGTLFSLSCQCPDLFP